MIDLNQPCIIGPGDPRQDGYHRVYIDGKRWLAHRYAYIMTYGPPPPDKPFILHKCFNRACWNVAHLKSGTIAENNQDTIIAGTHRQLNKTHCPKGHPYRGDNLIVIYKKSDKTQRVCRTCEKARLSKQYAIKKAKLPPRKIKTHCPQNHEYNESNTRHYRGRRYCKSCSKDRK